MKSLDQIERMASGKSPAKKAVKRTHYTKVNYPWIRRNYSCSAKAYIAWLVDSMKLEDTVIKDESQKKSVFRDSIYPKVTKKFPKLFKFVRNYYRKRGRKLDKKHFFLLIYARLVNMYEQGFTVRTKEHPLHSNNKMIRDAYRGFDSPEHR